MNGNQISSLPGVIHDHDDERVWINCRLPSQGWIKFGFNRDLVPDELLHFGSCVEISMGNGNLAIRPRTPEASSETIDQELEDWLNDDEL